MANGSAISLEPFQLPRMKNFSGKPVFIVQSAGKGGTIKANVESEGLQAASYTIKVQ